MITQPTIGQGVVDGDKAHLRVMNYLPPAIEPSIRKLASKRDSDSLNHIRNDDSLMSNTWRPSEEPGEIFQRWMTSWKKQPFPPQYQNALSEHHRLHRSSASTAGFHVPTYRDGSYMNSFINSII